MPFLLLNQHVRQSKAHRLSGEPLPLPLPWLHGGNMLSIIDWDAPCRRGNHCSVYSHHGSIFYFQSGTLSSFSGLSQSRLEIEKAAIMDINTTMITSPSRSIPRVTMTVSIIDSMLPPCCHSKRNGKG